MRVSGKKQPSNVENARCWQSTRLSYGTSCRLTRTAPNEALQFHEWSIPAGVSTKLFSLYIYSLIILTDSNLNVLSNATPQRKYIPGLPLLPARTLDRPWRWWKRTREVHGLFLQGFKAMYWYGVRKTSCFLSPQNFLHSPPNFFLLVSQKQNFISQSQRFSLAITTWNSSTLISIEILRWLPICSFHNLVRRVVVREFCSKKNRLRLDFWY